MTTIALSAPLAGFALPITDVPDPVFAGGLAGDGVAIDPTNEVVYAPCTGEVGLMPAGRHALTLRTGGFEVLLHVGIDTVHLNGAGFELLITDGAQVTMGQPLMRFSLDRVVREARSAVTPLLLAGPPSARVVRRVTGRAITVGEFLMEICAADTADAASASTEAVLRRRFTIAFEHGLHARPAALIVGALKGLVADVKFVAHGRQVNARSTVALMSLGMHAGESVEVRASGADANQALASLERLLGHNVTPGRAVPRALATAPPGLIRGVVAARGVAVGVAVPVVEPEPIVPEVGSGVDVERSALSTAIASVRNDISRRIADAKGPAAGILAAHLEIVGDPELERLAADLIRDGRSAAYAYRQASRDSAATLMALDDARLRERATDLRDVELQVISVLLGLGPSAGRALPDRAIVLADELSPSQLIAFDPARLAGIVTARGGPTSHVAIIAASMRIPALVAAGEGVLAVENGTPLVLDAETGELHVDPSPAERTAATERVLAHAAVTARELDHAADAAVTQDGCRIAVYANVGDSEEAAAAVRLGAEGCGLLRTEFLFLDRSEPPSEDEQVAAYTAIARALGGRPLVIRTLDAGGDKPIAYLPMPHEDNPALGLRGLRTSLARPELLVTQLRAIVRASDSATCRILLPMVTEVAEVREVRAALDAACAALDHRPTPELGVMIETPASALLADQLAAEADFLSIGTNDLSQYTLAMDRTHGELARRLDALHPASLRLIERAADAAGRRGREAAVCGALASDAVAVPLLVGFGVRALSAVPATIPRIKALLRTIRLSDCETLARSALALYSAPEVRAFAARWQAQVAPVSGGAV